jgi:[NiFe] hydrogenase assembly HybE family chaperone
VSQPAPVRTAASAPAPNLPALLRQTERRAAALQAGFEHIQRTRMADVPMLHPGLQVQAVGFEPEPDGAFAVGVLVTPWFMNLMRLPLAPQEQPLPVGETAVRRIGQHRMQFIGGHEPAIGDCGRYEMCSLFSPMGEFVDHEAAAATAREVLQLLRSPGEEGEPANAATAEPAAEARAPAATPAAPARPAAPPARPPEPVPARRGFLFGRGAAGR